MHEWRITWKNLYNYTLESFGLVGSMRLNVNKFSFARGMILKLMNDDHGGGWNAD